MVSIHARSLEEQHNWQIRRHRESVSMISYEDTLSGAGTLTFPFFIRWMQFAVFTSVAHLVFDSPAPEKRHPLLQSENVREQYRRFSQLRNRLFPTIYSLAHLARATGEKPVWGERGHPRQFRMGNALLVAPVSEPGAVERNVYLPEGIWYDYWDTTPMEGGRTVKADAAPEKIPVFVKAGSILLYRDNSRRIENGNNRRLTVEVYGGDRGTFRLYEDDGLTSRYRDGELSTTAFRYFEGDDYATFTIGRRVEGYDVDSDEKEFFLIFKQTEAPVSVSANEEKLKQGNEPGVRRWSYDDSTRTLMLKWIQPNHQKTDFLIRY